MGYLLGAVLALPVFVLWCYGAAAVAMWSWRKIGSLTLLAFPAGFLGAPYLIADMVGPAERPDSPLIVNPDSLVILLWIVATLAIGAGHFWRRHLWGGL